MKPLFFKHGDMLLPADEAQLTINTRRYNVKIETNDTDKYNRAASAAIDLDNGDIVWTGAIKITDSPLGRVIEPLAWYELNDYTWTDEKAYC